MIQNLIFVIPFFENIIFGLQLFYLRPHVLVDIMRYFFYSRFLSRKSQSQQRLAKKITHFTIQFRSRNLTHFKSLNSLHMENHMLPK